jgi:hypothetical protein
MRPSPPPQLDELGRAAWFSGFRATITRTPWSEVYRSGLHCMAGSAQRYCRDVIALRGARPSAFAAAEIERGRVLARRWMSEFWLIPPDRIEALEMRADGLDRAIAELCKTPVAY